MNVRVQEVCKQRVSVRTDHPTIAPGTQGAAIIDRFSSLLAEPLHAEGFTSVEVLESEEDTVRLFPELKHRPWCPAELTAKAN